MDIPQVLSVFQSQNVSISEIILHLVLDTAYIHDPLIMDLISSSSKICEALVTYKSKYNHEWDPNISVLDWAFRLVGERYKKEIKELVHVDNGWQFSAAHALAKKIEGFKIEEMAAQMEKMVPKIWEPLDDLLSAKKKQAIDPGDTQDDLDYWNHFGDLYLEGIILLLTNDTSARERRLLARRKAIISIVST